MYIFPDRLLAIAVLKKAMKQVVNTSMESSIPYCYWVVMLCGELTSNLPSRVFLDLF